jgi:SAM-dependent methyltransferase
MSKYLDQYKIPEDLNGKKVLEIGPANGYFSFEFAKRGAKVTAMDFHDKWWLEEINELMHARVKFKIGDLQSLINESEKYDFVFCSNVLQHNSDIVGNMIKIKNLTKERAIISIVILDDDEFPNQPIAKFLGGTWTVGTGKTVHNFWRPNMTCFAKMANFAGFSKVEKTSTFIHESEIFPSPPYDKISAKALEGVIHCFI